MKDKQEYSIELNSTQYQFLEEMVEQYALPDVGKALRILIDYTRDQSDKRDDIFNEIRCLDC